MPADEYRIADEPRPGALSHLVVHPLWPLLAFMLGGVWLSWPWFVFNGIALGSANRKRELLLAGLGLLGSFVIIFGLFALVASETVTGKLNVRFLLLGLTVWKLAISYILYTLQESSFEIHEYYGGAVRNGLLIVLLGAFFGRKYLAQFLTVDLLRLVLL